MGLSVLGAVPPEARTVRAGTAWSLHASILHPVAKRDLSRACGPMVGSSTRSACRRFWDALSRLSTINAAAARMGQSRSSATGMATAVRRRRRRHRALHEPERVPFTIVGVTPPEFFGVEVGRAFDVCSRADRALIRGRRFRTGFGGDEVSECHGAPDPASRSMPRPPRCAVSKPASVKRRSARGRRRWSIDTHIPVHAAPASTGVSNLRRSYERPLLFSRWPLRSCC